MIGIHDRQGSFSDHWIQTCIQREIPFRRVNCLAPSVIRQCEGLDGLLWHWAHDRRSDRLVAAHIIASLEHAGLLVFPNVATCWHYDDKVAQKFLLESVNAPLVPTWVFVEQSDAMEWIDSATWPKVFKLRCGAGSSNVRLVRSRSEAAQLCRQAFGAGFNASPDVFGDAPSRLRKAKLKGQLLGKLVRAPGSLLNRLLKRTRFPREMGYLYLQDFLPGNDFDTRVTVIGNRAFGFIRHNRAGDFRASGSGMLDHDPKKVDYRCVQIAFQVAEAIGAQSLAFDFLFDPDGKPLIGEISYCYLSRAVYECPGYWDKNGGWHAEQIRPEEAILEDLLRGCERKRQGKPVLPQNGNVRRMNVGL